MYIHKYILISILFLLTILTSIKLSKITNTYVEKFGESNIAKKRFTYDENVDDAIRLSLCKNNVKCLTYQANKGSKIVKEDKPYLLIHIPKNAGTFVRQVLPGMNGSHDHLTINEIKRKFPNILDDLYTFAIIRNPWERCVSMYNNHVKTNNMDIKGWGAYGMEILKKHNVNSFEDFVKLLHKNKSNIRKLGEIVWEKQINFITDEQNNIIVDKLIRIEDLDWELENLKNKFNIIRHTPVNKINVTNSGDYRKYYTNLTQKLVQDIYSEDILLGNYVF